MSFVNERISTAEAVAEFESFRFISPATGKAAERWKWTIDRERGLYFISLGGGFSEIPDFFGLVIHGKLILIECLCEAFGEREAGNIEVTWRILSMRIPSALSGQIKAIQQLVHEAFVTHGLFCDGRGVRRVTVIPGEVVID